MKLGALKSQIRAAKGNPPMLLVQLMPGVLTKVALLKTNLLESLDEAFPGGKSVETGLELHVSGDEAILRPEGSTQPYGMMSAAPGPLVEIMEAPVTSTSLLDLDDVTSDASEKSSLSTLLV